MQVKGHPNKPLLRTKGFSTHHIEIFDQILIGKTNREISEEYGYTKKSHAVVDHSRKVMYKLLAKEELPRAEYADHVKQPRKYLFWWKHILDKNRNRLYAVAITPKFYIE